MQTLMTGSPGIICNVWSDAAREASAEARRRVGNPQEGRAPGNSARANSLKDHMAAVDYHKGMADYLKKSDPEGADLHTKAAIAHQAAVNVRKPGAGVERATQAAYSKKAREATNTAHGFVPMK